MNREVPKQPTQKTLAAPRWQQRRTDVMYAASDYFYAELYSTKVYADTMRFVPCFEFPMFYFKEVATAVPGLTNRKINEWDTIGLISGQRENKEAGWRKYSPIEVLLLNIISDLRTFGFDTPSVKKVLGRLRCENVEVDGKSAQVDPLGFFFWQCLPGTRAVLIIDEDRRPIICEEELAVRLHFVLDRGTRPILFLPFSNYIERLVELFKEQGPRWQSELEKTFEVREKFTDDERTLLECLWNPKTARMEVSKAPDRKLTVKTYERESGDMDEEKVIELLHQARKTGFGTVTVNVTDGKYSRVEVAQSKKLQGYRKDRAQAG